MSIAIGTSASGAHRYRASPSDANRYVAVVCEGIEADCVEQRVRALFVFADNLFVDAATKRDAHQRARHELAHFAKK